MALEVIKIFISHTDDTKGECIIAKEIIREESELHYKKDGFNLEPFCWDDIPRGRGDPQEDLVDPLIKDEHCKLIIMVLWTHFGNPTRKYASGMEHEYNLVKENSKNILIFFSNKSVMPMNIDPEQLKKVQEFKRRVRNERYCADCGDFGDEGEFKQKFRGQLVANIDKIISNNKKIDNDALNNA